MSLSYDFSGRTAVVTGASRGIGRGVAAALAAAGAEVWNWSTSDTPQDGVRFRAVDVTDADAIALAAKEIDRLDILVNNAGTTGGVQPFDAMTPAVWRRVIDVNLTGVYEVTRACLPALRRAPAGRIVNIASIAGKEGPAGLSAYSAAKGGVIALTKSLAKELADTPIRVNCVTPSAIATEILKQLGPEFLAASVAKVPMGRTGAIEEVANLTLWLASVHCSFSTGAVFDISGGRSDY